MERFLEIKIGMSLQEVENILQQKVTLEKQREEYFKSDIAHFKEIGIWLFFQPDTQIIETIRYESPFSLSIDGIYIGDTQNQVKEIKGKAPRVNPFPTQNNTIWIYGKSENKDWVRFDFEKKRNGKCLEILR